MSGGTFDYKQYQIDYICESIQSELDRQGTLKPKSELWNSDIEYYIKYPDELRYSTHPIEVQQIMKDAIRHLKLARIYAHRIDWYIAGDDGAETLLRRLKEDLDKENLNDL